MTKEEEKAFTTISRFSDIMLEIDRNSIIVLIFLIFICRHFYVGGNSSDFYGLSLFLDSLFYVAKRKYFLLMICQLNPICHAALR